MMGGQSFKCPNCDKWFLSVRAWRDHLYNKHGLKNVKLSSTPWQ